MNQTLNPTAFKKSTLTIDPVFVTNQATDTTLSKTLHGFYKDKNMGGTFYGKRMSEQPKVPTEGQLVVETDNLKLEPEKAAHQRGFS